MIASLASIIDVDFGVRGCVSDDSCFAAILIRAEWRERRKGGFRA